jgi:outer membrane receptor protein involved in Fe transport
MKNQKQRNIRPTRKLLACALASCLMLGVAPAVFAQSTSATLRGQVSADSAPATDAKVTATNLATGLTRSVQANAGGGYSLGGLPPGSYRIDVTAAGKTSSQNVVLSIGQTATLNLGVGGVAETAAGEATNLDTVTVTAPALLETKTSEVATYVTQKQIDALPQGSRNFLAFADIVPGMIFDTKSDGSTSLRSGAQNSNGINVFIDGVGQKNYVLKGGIGGQEGSRGNPFPQLAIGEYKVITSNYKAEYDQISSAAVTAVTKSGTNEFHGSLFWDQNGTEQWRTATPAEDRAGGDKAPSGETQYGVALGGPIIQDSLFFFATYEAKEFSIPRTISAINGDPGTFLPEDLAAMTGPSSTPFNEDLWFGKLTWQLGDASLIELSVKRREESEIKDIGGQNTESYGKTNNNDSTRYDLRYQWSGVNWLNDAHLTYEDEAFNPRAINIGPGFNLQNNNRGTILNYGGGQDFQDKGQTGWGFQDDLTFTGIEGHTMQMGVKYKSVEINAFEQQPYNPQYSINLTANEFAGNFTTDDFIPYQVRFGAPLPGVGDRNIKSTNKQFGIYFQDDWEVNEKLTLNLGLRYDYEQTPGYEDYVTPAALVAALRGWTNIQNTDYDIEDYISDGSNRESFKGAWQPRLGFSYDLFADQRHVIFGGAGRSYDRNLFDYIALEQSKSTFPSYTVSFFDAPQLPGNEPACATPGPTCVAWDPAYFNPDNLYALVAANPALGSEVNLINNDIDVPYSDQFSLGMRNTLEFMGNDWNTSASIVHVKSYDGIIFTLGNRYPDGSFYGPGRTFGGAPFGNPIPGYGSLIKADNGVETRLNQFLLSVDKPYSRSSPWGVTLAYTYTDSEENRSEAANSDEHYVFDYANLDDAPWVESIGISKHRLVGTGIADFWGFTFSTKVLVASPVAKNVLNCLAPVAPGIDACGNGTFEAGYFDDAKVFQWDLAVQKVWDTGTDLKLRVRADVFNVTNERNWTGFNTFKGTNNVVDPGFGNHNDDIMLPTRTFKLSFGLDW